MTYTIFKSGEEAIFAKGLIRQMADLGGEFQKAKMLLKSLDSDLFSFNRP